MMNCKKVSPDKIDDVMQAMIAFDKGDPFRIHHFMKVYEFARMIALYEGLDEETFQTLQVAAILHDIGIHPSEAKYGNGSGHYQEMEGPSYAEKLLKEVGGFDQERIDRVCYLIGHHHTYTNVDGLDYRILLEADFLVNALEDKVSEAGVAEMKKKVFRTKTGIRLLEQLFEEKYTTGQN